MLGDSLLTEQLFAAGIASPARQRRLFDEALAARDWKSLAELCDFHNLDPDVDASLRDVDNMDVRVAWLHAPDRTMDQVLAVLEEDGRIGVAEKLAKNKHITADMARLLATRQHPRVAAALTDNTAISDELWKEIAPQVVGQWAKSRMSASKAPEVWAARFSDIEGAADAAMTSFLERGTPESLDAAVRIATSDPRVVDPKMLAAVFDAVADFFVSTAETAADRDKELAKLFHTSGVGHTMLFLVARVPSDVLGHPVVAPAAGRLGLAVTVPNLPTTWTAYRSAATLATYGSPATEDEVKALLRSGDGFAAATLARRCDSLSLDTLEELVSAGFGAFEVSLDSLEAAVKSSDSARTEGIARLLVRHAPIGLDSRIRSCSLEVAEVLLRAVADSVPKPGSEHGSVCAAIVATYPQLVGSVPVGALTVMVELAALRHPVPTWVAAAKTVGDWWFERCDGNSHLEEAFESMTRTAQSHTLEEVWAVAQSLSSAA